ncbi:MAG: hypothetical protein JST48_06020 [Bacteroidetes bacterium]|nr:hypothetical protein [Bacteroidota bacterium]
MQLNALWAQKNNRVPVRWEKTEVMLPGMENQKSLGVAGAVCGVYREVLMVGGGSNFPEGMPWAGGKKKYYSDLFIYQRKPEEIQYLKSTSLPLAVAYSASCSTTRGVVFAGGENETGILKHVVLLKWDEHANDILISTLPELPVAITNASIVASGSKVYLAGGETSTGVSNQFMQLDLDHASDGWKTLEQLPTAVSHSVMALQYNGSHERIYLMGGRQKNKNGISTLFSSVYEFDLEQNKWKPKKDLPHPLSAGTGIAVGINSILLFSGDTGETFSRVEKLLAEIKNETDLKRKKELSEKKNVLLSSHPGFNKEILKYNTVTDSWEKTGTIPFDGQVTTTAVKWNDDVIIPTGEIRAGVRTPAIHVGKIMVK